MSAPSALSPPLLLLAMPQVADPFFRKSVILLLAHEEEGSFGFIVNRRTELKVAEILADLKLAWGGDDDELAQFGGPVQPQVGTVLFSNAGDELPPFESASEVFPGIHLTQHIGELATLAGRPPDRFRLLLGYAGWGNGQLVSEIVRNDWLLAPVDPALIFGGGTEAVWEAALVSVGVDPSTLPAWTTAEPESPAN
ncbi:MAG: YqgE/AlgH family protein [Thermoanaerobaculia bacterium]